MLLLALLAATCGSPVRRSVDVPLSDVVFRLRHGGISGAVPVGWTTAGPAAGDSTAAMTLAGGDSLRIVFRQVSLDSSSAAYFRRRGVADLAMVTRTLYDSTVGNARKGIATFRAGGREFATYEVRSNGNRMRVAVFGAGQSYYECVAAPSKPLPGAKSYDRLFDVQDAVLRSLR